MSCVDVFFDNLGSITLPVTRVIETFGSTDVDFTIDSQFNVEALVIEDPYNKVMIDESGYQNKYHILVITDTELRCSDDKKSLYFDQFIYKGEIFRAFKCRDYPYVIDHFEVIARREDVRHVGPFPPEFNCIFTDENGEFFEDESGATFVDDSCE